jgi:ubiquinone/menaquinone biosynthesis C-methylase UbiE
MGYLEHTKNAYRNKVKAKAYKDQYIKGTKWARFTMWRQKSIVQSFVNYCSLGDEDFILDIPCGAGYLGEILDDTRAGILASDISMEMMDLALEEYNPSALIGFVQADITEIPVPSNTYKAVIVLALMHRLPSDIRSQVLAEVQRVSSKYVVVSYSVESLTQKLKQWLLLTLKPSHIPAPASIPLNLMKKELVASGFEIIKMRHIMYFLSAKVVFLAKKK